MLGIKFSTFCEKYILGEVLKYLREDKNIKISRDIFKLKKKVDIARDHYFKSKGEYPSLDILCMIVNEEKSKVLEVLNLNQNVQSIDESVNEDNDNISIKDVIYIYMKQISKIFVTFGGTLAFGEGKGI